MVNKSYCREVIRKWISNRSPSDLPSARLFTEPKCQRQVEQWYLFYRWLVFIAWISIIICSLFEVGSYKPLGNIQLWLVYLTNWDLALGATQAFLGAILVTRRWRLQKTNCNFEPTQLILGKLEKTYWFFYIVTSTMALGVTITYWCTVYDPKIHQVDPLNIMLHVCNSLLMLLDLCIISVPFTLRHFWWCLIVIVFYLIFSIVYYFAGGLDKLGNHYIYKVLDWEKPVRTLFVCLGGLTFVIIMHCLLYFVALLRDYFYARYYKIDKETDKKYLKSNISQKPVTKQSTEIIV